MASITTISERVRELSSGSVYLLLQDDLGVPIGSGSLNTLTLSLYDKRTGTVINSRNNLNALNANNVTVYSSVQGSGTTAYTVLWEVQPADNALVGTRELEPHRAIFEYTWGSGKRDHHGIDTVIEAELEVS